VTTSNNRGSRFINTTVASLVFAVLLTFGFIWATIHDSAPFTTYAEGLGAGLLIIVGKRLAQKASFFGGITENGEGNGNGEELPNR
jgi:hypothetical protein